MGAVEELVAPHPSTHVNHNEQWCHSCQRLELTGWEFRSKNPLILRFEVIAAFAIGILLPFLETCRRGISEWGVDVTTMLEDYLGGALLLIGAWATYTEKRWGALFLVVAWAGVSSMIFVSFLGQLEGTIRHTIDEPHSSIVLVIKFLLMATSLFSLVLSFRRVSNTRSA